MGEFERDGFSRMGLDASSAWIEPSDAKRHFDSGNAIFVDVRDAFEFLRSHVPGALQLDSMLVFVLETTDEYETIVSEPDKIIILYSDNGSQISRCGSVAQALRDN